MKNKIQQCEFFVAVFSLSTFLWTRTMVMAHVRGCFRTILFIIYGLRFGSDAFDVIAVCWYNATSSLARYIRWLRHTLSLVRGPRTACNHLLFSQLANAKGDKFKSSLGPSYPPCARPVYHLFKDFLKHYGNIKRCRDERIKHYHVTM